MIYCGAGDVWLYSKYLDSCLSRFASLARRIDATCWIGNTPKKWWWKDRWWSPLPNSVASSKGPWKTNTWGVAIAIHPFQVVHPLSLENQQVEEQKKTHTQSTWPESYLISAIPMLKTICTVSCRKWYLLEPCSVSVGLPGFMTTDYQVATATASPTHCGTTQVHGWFDLRKAARSPHPSFKESERSEFLRIFWWRNPVKSLGDFPAEILTPKVTGRSEGWKRAAS